MRCMATTISPHGFLFQYPTEVAAGVNAFLAE
jgi:hypothetical protein